MTESSGTNAAAHGLLEDKVALVTGAGRGIGAAAARLFAREGASVVLTSRTESELSAVVDELRAAGGAADYVVADMADAEGIQSAVDKVVEGHGRLDVAFNNAGVSAALASLAEVPGDDFDRVTSVDYRGVWLAMVAEIKAMRATAGGGAIVNNSSTAGLRSSARLGPYSASKRAVNSLTETAALEYGPEGIRVNAIAPGTTMTAMFQQLVKEDPDIVEQFSASTPLRRVAAPEEVAEAAAWLLSDRASYVTGVVVPVDGGLTI